MAPTRLNPHDVFAVIEPYVQQALDAFQVATGGRLNAKGRLAGGVRPTVTSTVRSRSKQEELYRARGRNQYPVNRPGDSAHEFGLAFDSSFSRDQKSRYMPLWTTIRREVGFRVPENDEVHAEVPGWRELVGLN